MKIKILNLYSAAVERLTILQNAIFLHNFINMFQAR
jgi:hypothetical protein